MELKTNDYKFNDNEVIYLISENSEDAKDFLFQKYSGMIHGELNKVKKSAYALGIDWNDLIQEALLGFSHALNSYDEENEAQFSTFATLCVKRRLINFIDKNRTAKNFAMKSALSINDQDNLSIKNSLKEADGREPLNKLITKEDLSEIGEKYDNNLSEEEKKVLSLMLDGKSAQEIADMLELSVKRVYNLIYRARQKLKL